MEYEILGVRRPIWAAADPTTLTAWAHLGCTGPTFALRKRHNDHYSVSNHLPLDCLFKTLFKPTSKETSKSVLLALCEGNPTVNSWRFLTNGLGR